MQIHEHEQRGFSILEILISLAIGLIVLTALGTTFVAQRKAYMVQEQLTDMVQTGRAALDIMGREIQMAGYDPSESMQNTATNPGTGEPQFAGINPVSSSQIDIYADLNGDGDTSGDTNEHITYAFNSSTGQITRDTNTGSGAQPFAENVESMSFAYLDEDGNATTTPDEIHQIVLTLTVRTAKADPNFPDNDGYRTQTLTSSFIPRNMNATTTTALASTTSTTSGECDLSITIDTLCRQITGVTNKYIYLKVYVSDTGSGNPVTGATVTWTISGTEPEPAAALSDLGGGYYGGSSVSTCSAGISQCKKSVNMHNESQNILISAVKEGCLSDAISEDSG